MILANGAFPAGAAALGALHSAVRVVCCDGAADKLLAAGAEPSWIVGDGDSVSAATHARFADRCRFDAEQETNDLAKAFRFCLVQGWREIVILGATGGREDHTLGNLSLLADFAREADVRLVTDTGCFTPLLASAQLESTAGQQVSLIACDAGMRVTAEGLKYPARDLPLSRWWQGTLNEACGASFDVSFDDGALLVFQNF